MDFPFTKVENVEGLEFATQAEAEAGTDNTKVMTPLRVKDARKIYGSVQDIGLTNSCTWADIETALKQKSTVNAKLILYKSISDSNVPNLILPPIPTGGNGVVRIKAEVLSGILSITLHWSGANAKHIAMSNNGTFSGWKQLATNGALSMPSGKAIWLDISEMTINSSSQLSLDIYTAPCDGWISIACKAANENYHELTTKVNGNFFTIDLWSTNHTKRIIIPVAKNDIVTLRYTNLSDLEATFYYAQSEV